MIVCVLLDGDALLDCDVFSSDVIVLGSEAVSDGEILSVEAKAEELKAVAVTA